MTAVAQGILTGQKDKIRTESISETEANIFKGISFNAHWRESAVGAASSEWALFTVPDGYYLELYFRLITSEAEDFIYRVYPEGTFTAGPVEADDGNDFTKTRNLRQNSSLTFPDTLQRVDMDDVSATKPGATDFLVFVDSPGAQGQGQKTAGELASDESFLLLNPDQAFLLEMYNGSNGASINSVSLLFNFIPEANVPPEETT